MINGEYRNSSNTLSSDDEASLAVSKSTYSEVVNFIVSADQKDTTV
jgi:hypothetical protein